MSSLVRREFLSEPDQEQGFTFISSDQGIYIQQLTSVLYTSKRFVPSFINERQPKFKNNGCVIIIVLSSLNSYQPPSRSS
jgi:hypothetical protein